MHQTNRLLARFFCIFLALTLLLSAACQTVLAEEFVAPRLSSDAAPYDPEKPDELDEDQLYAKSAILINAATGEPLFEKDADAIMYPASTTKILTLLLALEKADLTQTVYLSESAMWGIGEGDATMDLDIGESIVMEDLMFGTFIRSANEGANLIAETVSGSQEAFVAEMNQKAFELGCTSTYFMNPSGLHDPSHVTTVRDMAVIAREAMKNDKFREIAKTYTYTLPASNLHRARVLTHSSRSFFNPSLEENEAYYEYATGIKTGFTNAAGYCFVGSAERNGLELISVVFYTTAAGRWSDTKKLMEYGFSQFVSMTPQQLYMENPVTVETSGFALDDPGYGRLELAVRAQAGSQGRYITATKDEMAHKIRNLRQTLTFEYTRDFVAPIQQGEVMGTMTYYPEDVGTPVVYDLVASRSIERRADAPLSLEEIEALVYSDPNPFPPMSVEFSLLLLVPAAGLYFLIRLLWRLTRRGKEKTKKRKKSSVKPQNRFYR